MDRMERTGEDLINLISRTASVLIDDSIYSGDVINVDALMNAYDKHIRTTTPEFVMPRITAICKEIDSESTPIFLDVPVPPPPPSDKLLALQILNVNNPFNPFKQAPIVASERKCSTVFGWAIWEGQWWYDCQPHMVIKNTDGSLEDITPQMSGDLRILFLPDTMRTWSDQGEQNKLFAKVNYTTKELKKPIPKLVVDMINVFNKINKIKLTQSIRAKWQHSMNSFVNRNTDNYMTFSGQIILMLKKLEALLKKEERKRKN